MYAVPPPATMPSSAAARVARKRIFYAVLLLFLLYFGSSSDFDHRDSSGELGKALLEASRGRSRTWWINLHFDLVHAVLDVLLLSRAADDGAVVFIGDETLS